MRSSCYKLWMACSIEGCPRPHHAHGWCSHHLGRFERYGDPLGVPAPPPTDEERFWNKVDKSGSCWLWTGAKNQGYGMFVKKRGSAVVAHRMAWFLTFGLWPAGDLDHECHNGSGCSGGPSCPHRACVNPRHLADVPHVENVRRGEGLAGINARKTHCIRGHEFTSKNTRVDRNGHRACRACQRLRSRDRYAARRGLRQVTGFDA